MPQKSTTQKDALASASKTINRCLTAVHRVGNLKGLESKHINQIENALKSQVEKAIAKLRTPSGKSEGFSFN